MKHVDTDPGKLQKPTVIDRRGDTDDAEMIANDAYQQTMYETPDQEEGDDKPYPEIPAVSYAAPEKGEPNTQKRLCHKDVLDMTNVPGNTAHNIFDTKHRTNVSDVQDVPDVKVVSGVQDVIMSDVQNIPDVPRTTTHNTKGLQTNSRQTSPRQVFAATLATYNEEFTTTTLATYDEEFAAILATYDEEFAATTLANYDEELAAATTLNTYDEEFAAATLATYDEEIAAVEGEPWGITKCAPRA